MIIKSVWFTKKSSIANKIFVAMGRLFCDCANIVLKFGTTNKNIMKIDIKKLISKNIG